MKTKIKIYTQTSGWIEAQVDSNRNPDTAKHILEALPISGKTQTWGKEIYFPISVEMHEENTQVEVEIGDLAYWPPGNSFCIFFGKTPASRGDKPAAASPVNVFGKIKGNISGFLDVPSGETIRIELG